MHTIFNKATQTLTKCPEMMHPKTLEHFQNYTERQWPRAFCKKMKMWWHICDTLAQMTIPSFVFTVYCPPVSPWKDWRNYPHYFLHISLILTTLNVCCMHTHTHTQHSNLLLDGGEDGGGGFRLGAVSVGGVEDGAQHGGSAGSVSLHLRHWHTSCKNKGTWNSFIIIKDTVTCQHLHCGCYTYNLTLVLTDNYTHTHTHVKAESQRGYRKM